MRLLLFIALASIACDKKKEDPGPACPQIVDHMLAITKQQMAGHDTVEMGNRTQMIEHCEKRNMSREMRTCIMGAKNLTGLGECQRANKPAPAPAPTGSGG
jgi:hypothetical protein